MKQIPLTQGKFAVVDDADFEWLNQWKWGFSSGYARRLIWVKGGKGKQIIVYMHRLIMNPPDVCDHINGNRLDNRRSNLRNCTQGQNTMNRSVLNKNNTSRYRGVSWFKRDGIWHAQIYINRKNLHLGYFDKLIDAAKAYNVAAVKFYGEFATLNKI